MIDRERIIKNYVEGYNQFDIDKMTADFSRDIVFENIQNGEVNMTLNGLNEFKEQAENAKAYFSARSQVITVLNHFESKTEIEIDYHAVLAMDFPNGMKAGEELNLKGKSVFEFLDNKILKLSDIS
ncbi:nuclear transport factor 2 family protein [Flavobacterium lipolyticum]|uniref:Nuclear transport factor 2 family protein n=1 Tax=Flavobacterium lipolyticum TaxID=2893754 RepID=A0ABS8LY34_9FLAO|nr:nuclear transport factor 2 family protein [Flavobacterium sp. F-126]MCC9017485.1 nuclear transport factor 2 family protein [Flavobacterium sp. F-126]